MTRKSLIILAALVILGFFLRIYKMWDVPMYGDELTMVYDAYSIIKTGKDATGEALPITFRMGAGRPGGYIYFSLPFVYLFGPTQWGERSLSLFSGLGLIVVMFFLGKKLFSEKLGLFASFITSISMWDIYLSRAGFEAHFALLLSTLGITLFLHKKYILWAVVWGITILTYPTYKLTLPLIFLILVLYTGLKKLINKKSFIVSLVILALFGSLVFREIVKGRSEERLLQINVFSDEGVREQIIQKVNSERNFTMLPSFLIPYFYNKPFEYGRILLENYADNLSPHFFFLRGDGNPRYNPGEWGMFYLAEVIPLFFGVFYLLKNEKKKLKLLLSWILIVPLAGMFIANAHSLRSSFMLPAVILLTSYGFLKLKLRWRTIVLVLIALQIPFVFQRVYFLAPGKFAGFWSKEAKDESLKAMEKDKIGEDYTLSTKIDNIEYAYPVYAKIDPNEVIKQYGKFPKVYGNVVISDTNE